MHILLLKTRTSIFKRSKVNTFYVLEEIIEIHANAMSNQRLKLLRLDDKWQGFAAIPEAENTGRLEAA